MHVYSTICIAEFNGAYSHGSRLRIDEILICASSASLCSHCFITLQKFSSFSLPQCLLFFTHCGFLAFRGHGLPIGEIIRNSSFSEFTRIPMQSHKYFSIPRQLKRGLRIFMWHQLLAQVHNYAISAAGMSLYHKNGQFLCSVPQSCPQLWKYVLHPVARGNPEASSK